MKKASFYIIYVVFILILFEFTFRIFYAISFKEKQILWRPYAVLNHYYPGITEAMDAQVKADQTFDILLLGGSVLTPSFGFIPQELKILLDDSLGIPFKIHNVAAASHTSHDSKAKYDLLKNQDYDMVILYHAINEIRFNHCPPEVFRKDYGHVDFYAKVNGLLNSKLTRYTVMTLVYYQLKVSISKKINSDAYMPFHELRSEKEEWLVYGDSIKTAPVFKANMSYIVAKALEKHQNVDLPKFVYYVPENYSFELFKAKKLNYGKHKSAVEVWGTPIRLDHGMKIHNAKILEIADENRNRAGFVYLDFTDSIPKNKIYFDDPCHFTKQGSTLFVRQLWPSLRIAANNMMKRQASDLHKPNKP